MQYFQVVAKVDGGPDLARRLTAISAEEAAFLMMDGLNLAPVLGDNGPLVRRLGSDIKLFHATDEIARSARVLVWEVA